MTYTASYPMDQTQLLNIKLAPKTQPQLSGQSQTVYADRTVVTPQDSATFSSEGITVIISLSMEDPSALVTQLNNAGIPCTIDRSGILVLTGTDRIPTSNDPNVIKALGFRHSFELREDGGHELRQTESSVIISRELRDDGETFGDFYFVPANTYTTEDLTSFYTTEDGTAAYTT